MFWGINPQHEQFGRPERDADVSLGAKSVARELAPYFLPAVVVVNTFYFFLALFFLSVFTAFLGLQNPVQPGPVGINRRLTVGVQSHELAFLDCRRQHGSICRS